MSYENARDALLNMVRTRRDSRLTRLQREIEDVDPRQLEELLVPGYDCSVSLQHNRFSILVFRKHVEWDYSGRFEQGAGGKWHAIIEQVKEVKLADTP